MTDLADRVRRTMLVVRCQTGDTAAFKDLMDLYERPVHYFLAKMVGNPLTADDLSQEVWFEVFRGIGRLNDPGAFKAWLYQTARHRALRALRSRVPTTVSPGELEIAADHGEDSFAAEEAERIHAALDELPHEQREVLLLRYIEDMTYEEIARVTHCQLGTVRSRLHYAKRALRRVLERTTIHER
jgi:RNA polymerase sigma-70 factor (ECF subfamily)